MKTHVMRRIFAGMLAVLMLSAFVSCAAPSGETVPDGMQIATAQGSDFRLYVPTTWNLNTAYGISGAYYSLTNQSTVSVVKYPITEKISTAMGADAAVLADVASTRIDWFFEHHLKEALSNAVTGTVKPIGEASDTILGDANARKYQYNATIGEEVLTFLQVVAERANAFYVFTFTATEELYRMLCTEGGDINAILTAFRFAESYTPTEILKPLSQDPKTPEGMKIASNGDVMYRFYVPTSWTVDQNQSIFSAKSEDGLSLVSVVPYMPNGNATSVLSYFAETEKMLKRTSGDSYHKLSEVRTALGGGDAMRYEYIYAVGGIEFRYIQVIGNFRGMIYNLTYAAKTTDFDAHVSDFETILKEFAYR